MTRTVSWRGRIENLAAHPAAMFTVMGVALGLYFWLRHTGRLAALWHLMLGP